MLFLNTRQMPTGIMYQHNADQNLTELKALMKDLIIKDIPKGSTPAVWAISSLPQKITVKDASTQTQTSTQIGARVWAFGPRKKKEATVKTFKL